MRSERHAPNRRPTAAGLVLLMVKGDDELLDAVGPRAMTPP